MQTQRTKKDNEMMSQNALKRNTSEILLGAAIVLILVTGLIHLVEAPENYEEAAYKGILFALNGIGALVAAVGIYRGSRTWGWGLGLVVAGGALVTYVISRTIGLPMIGVDDEWLEPLGVLSLIVEVAFVVSTFVYASRSREISDYRESQSGYKLSTQKH